MPRKFVLTMIFLGLLLGACGRAPPDILLWPEQIDMGQVPNGEIRQIEVEVQNIGESPLRIEQISTSCGCTTAGVDHSIVAVGETTILTVSFDSGAHGPEFTGSVVREVFLVTNDPDEEEVTFRFSADVTTADP
jgi:hypothetical protein